MERRGRGARAARWSDARRGHRLEHRARAAPRARRHPAQRRRIAGAGAGDDRPDRLAGDRVGQPRQAPAAAAGRTRRRRAPHPPLPPADGRGLAHVRPGASAGPEGPVTRSGRCYAPRGRWRSATTCTNWRWCRPATRSGSWAGSDPTRSATTGTSTRRSGGCWPSRRPRSARPCWTSANSPGSATSTGARRSSCAGCRRGPRSARSRTCAGWSRWRTAAGGQSRPLDPEQHRVAAPGRDHLRVRPPGAALPPLRHADPDGGAGRAGHLLVPRLPARPVNQYAVGSGRSAARSSASAAATSRSSSPASVRRAVSGPAPAAGAVVWAT